jgi:hypothetical protein
MNGQYNEQYKIFAKKENDVAINKTNYERKILSKNEILSSIPQNALEQEDINLSLSKIELRWRIFKIPNIENEIIEISQKEPNKNRLYMNQNGNWVEYNDNDKNKDKYDKYEQYIVKKFYYYQ